MRRTAVVFVHVHNLRWKRICTVFLESPTPWNGLPKARYVVPDSELVIVGGVSVAHDVLIDESSAAVTAAAASTASACACSVGACSVGIRTRVVGKETLGSAASSLTGAGGLASLAIVHVSVSARVRYSAGIYLTRSHIDGAQHVMPVANHGSNCFCSIG
jgi:hypothetical protein